MKTINAVKGNWLDYTFLYNPRNYSPVKRGQFLMRAWQKVGDNLGRAMNEVSKSERGVNGE